MLEKTYQPEQAEGAHYQKWEQGGYFEGGRRPDADPFTIVIPPPNVTGSLHIGHALDNTLQDIIIRHERLKGKDAHRHTNGGRTTTGGQGQPVAPGIGP